MCSRLPACAASSASSAPVQPRSAIPDLGRHGPEAIEEDVPLHVVSERPASIYAATKLAGEHLAYLYNDLYGVDAVVLRYAAVLGGGSEPPSSVPGPSARAIAHWGETGEKVVLRRPVRAVGRTRGVRRRPRLRTGECARARCGDAGRRRSSASHPAPGSASRMFIDVVRTVHPRLQAEWPTDIRTGFAGSPIRVLHRHLSRPHCEISGFECKFSLEDTVRHWS